MSRSELANRRRRKAIELTIPTRRVATADDIGGMIAFLCSDFSQQVNGEIVNINGGSVLAG
jgi:enoyl-[acyl-carrier-protein] reductase (NADH)